MKTSGPPTFFESASPTLREFMERMGPCAGSESCESISLTGAMLCQIMVLNSVIERRGNRLIEEHGLTMPQWLALGCISNSGEEGIPHSQIGQRLMLSKAPITGIVDRLERASLVERRADAKDRRVSRAVATPKGVETWLNVRNTLRSQSDDVVAASLSPEEQETLLRLMGRLMDAYASNGVDLPLLAAKNLDSDLNSHA